MTTQNPKFTTHFIPVTAEEKRATAHQVAACLHEALDAFAQREAQRLGYHAGQRVWAVEEVLIALGAVMVSVARATQQHSTALSVAESVALQLELDSAPPQSVRVSDPTLH